MEIAHSHAHASRAKALSSLYPDRTANLEFEQVEIQEETALYTKERNIRLLILCAEGNSFCRRASGLNRAKRRTS